MSTDIPIQESAPDQLEGGQKPLANDNSDRRRGGSFDQNTLSFCRGTNVTPGTAGPVASAPNNREHATIDGMYVAAPVGIHVQPVDRRTLEGSTPGDYRKQASPAVLPNQPAPRRSVAQCPLSGRTPAAAAPQTFTGNNDKGN